MYIFQSLFNLVVTSNSGQAALTMPIMAPLSDLVGVPVRSPVLAFQLGAGFVDAFTPVSASLIGVLGVARIEWGKWAKFQIKMQAFFFLMELLSLESLWRYICSNARQRIERTQSPVTEKRTE